MNLSYKKKELYNIGLNNIADIFLVNFSYRYYFSPFLPDIPLVNGSGGRRPGSGSDPRNNKISIKSYITVTLVLWSINIVIKVSF